jgi:hypothetical protein
MLNPRAIAVQGVGFGRLFVALQGFVDAQPPAPREETIYGGGALSQAEFKRLYHGTPELEPTRRAARRRREEFFLLNRLH